MFDADIGGAVSEASESLKATVLQATGRLPSDDFIVFKVFPQVWAGSALGYTGMLTLHAITTAYTVVGFFGGLAFVYFGGKGRLAYVTRPNEVFLRDVADDYLHGQSTAPDRYDLVEATGEALNQALVFNPQMIPYPAILWRKES